MPIATITDRPTAEGSEYRPPTQSQKPNMLAVSMPNSATRWALVLTATKCLATAAWSPPRPASSQLRASVALVSVSCVVNVLDTMTNSVVAGSRSWVFSYRSVGSMLEMNRHSISALL